MGNKPDIGFYTHTRTHTQTQYISIYSVVSYLIQLKLQ